MVFNDSKNNFLNLINKHKKQFGSGLKQKWKEKNYLIYISDMY